jgi:glutamine amidotransferase
MCRRSDEGNTEGLGIFDADVRLFPSLDRIPHMGWNTLTRTSGEFFRDVAIETDYFFVHSYYAELSPHTVAVCDYIIPFSAAFVRDNFYATQFHPEKSGPAGEVILKKFLKL